MNCFRQKFRNQKPKKETEKDDWMKIIIIVPKHYLYDVIECYEFDFVLVVVVVVAEWLFLLLFEFALMCTDSSVHTVQLP